MSFAGVDLVADEGRPEVAGSAGLIQMKLHFDQPEMERVSVDDLDRSARFQSGAIDEGAVGRPNLVPNEENTLPFFNDGVAAAGGSFVVQRLEVNSRVDAGRGIEPSNGRDARGGEGSFHIGIRADKARLSGDGASWFHVDPLLDFPLLNGCFGNAVKQCRSCFPEPEAQFSQHSNCDLGIVLDQLVEGASINPNQSAIGDRSCGRSSRKVFEDGHFSEEITLFEESQPVFLAVGFRQDLDLPGLDDEHLISGLTFFEYPVTGGEGARKFVLTDRLCSPGLGHAIPLFSAQAPFPVALHSKLAHATAGVNR